MGLGKRLLSNTFYLFLDWFVLTLMGFVYWFIIGKTLLPEEYGIISTSTNLAILLSVISLFGFNFVLFKIIPEYLSKKQRKKITTLIRFSLKLSFLFNLIFALSLILFSGVIAPILKLPTQVIWFTTLIMIVFTTSSLLASVIGGFQEMKKLFTSDFLGQIMRIIISLSLIILGFRYYGPLIGFLICFLLAALIRFKFSYQHFQHTAVQIDKRKIIFNYALPAFVMSLSLVVFNNGQYVLLTIIQNTAITGIFTLAMVATSIIASFPGILSQALFPILSYLSTNKNSRKQQSYLTQLVFRYALFISIPIAAFLIIFSKTAILLFSRPEYLSASNLFPILVLGSLIYGLGNTFLTNLYAIGKTKINRNIMIATTAIFFMLSLPLTSYFSGFGMALSYTLAAVCLFILSYLNNRKYLKIHLPLTTIIKLIIAIIISFSFLKITTQYTTRLFIEILLAIIAGLIYLVVLLPMKFYTKEDVKILTIIAGKLTFLKNQILAIANFLSKFSNS